MKRISAIAILLSLLVPGARAGAQGPDGEALRERREKLRKILTVRDLRTPHDAALYRYLYDPDTLVRETATIAFGSLQDTAALTDLVNNLTDGPPSVRRAAAFAIGQTGPMLSERGREDLAHELIWIRSERLRDRGYLIEEIGKFGDLQALTDLMLKFGTDPEVGREHLFMSIARFGIRGVVASEAIQVLLGHVKTASPVSWRSVYALQRIGDHEEIRIATEDLVPLTRDPDPLVRLNAAALFGKLAPDGRVVEPLLRLADFDRDWRVRVNALRALGNFPPSTEIVETFRRAFVDPDLHIALTAINAFAGSATKDTGDGVVGGTAVAEIGRMARNEENGYRWQLQSAAAQALARITGERALELIRPRGNEEPLLLAGLITAMGSTGSPAAAMTLLGYEGAGEPLLRRSSLEALMEIARGRSAGAGLLDTVYGASIRGLESGDMAVVTVAAANLGDSLLLRRGSVGPLTAALDGLEAPGDIEAMQEICRTIGRIGDPATIPSLEKYLTHRDAALARAAAGALSVLTGRDESGRIPAEREPLHVDLDFAYLEDLPDTVGMVLETIHGDIRIDLYPRVAPFTVMTILKLAVNEGFYDGLIFHRVVPNFVVQGGDPRGDGWGGPGYSVRSEFSPLGYGTGTVGIASAGKDTEGSQFFITHSPQPHLDGRYTIIGRVVSGMPAVDALQVGDRIMDFRRVR